MSREPGKLVLAAYGSLAFPLAAAFIALQLFVPTYYAESTGLSLTAIGIVMLIAKLCDTVTDPIVGYLSDLTPTTWRRRKLYVVIATPLIVVSAYYLFNPPAEVSTTYLLLWTVAIYVAGTLSIVPMNAWGAELSDNYNTRSLIAGVRVAFGLVGSLAALVLAVIFASDNSAELAKTLSGITWLVVGTLVLATVLAALIVPDNKDTDLPEDTIASAWRVISQPTPFRQLLISFFLNAVGNAIPATLFVLFVTHVIDAEGAVGKLLFLYLACSAVSVPIWVALSKRFGKHQTWTIAILLAAAFFLWTPFLGADSLMMFTVIVIVTGFATGADLVLPSAINADIIEWDALQSGYRRPGLFFALWGTATKLSFALAIGIAFPLLDVVGFSATSTNDASAINGLAIMYGLPCIAFKLSALLLMRGYPITEEKHAEIRRQLAKRELQAGTV
ncbi:MAG: MFS transporter [Pseudomonadota bacterium]